MLIFLGLLGFPRPQRERARKFVGASWTLEKVEPALVGFPQQSLRWGQGVIEVGIRFALSGTSERAELRPAAVARGGSPRREELSEVRPASLLLCSGAASSLALALPDPLPLYPRPAGEREMRGL